MPKPKKIGLINKRERSNQFKIKNVLKNSKIDCLLKNLFRAYAEQTAALNRMRGMLEDENTMKR